MGIAVGIDLGTTNTVVAVVKDGVATTLPDAEGKKLIPSVVAFHPNGTVQVGSPALERRVIDPENTIYSVKRLIGRSFESPEVRQQKSRFPFRLVEGPKGATLVATRAETYALPEISAFVLRRAKAVAEEALGQTVDAAVITVPANFDDPQRASTKMAGKLAGLEVLRILNEPTAAALAYGGSRDDSERICVYDLGGGTFDVTLLDVSSGVYEVLATAGDTALGGDDIDAVIVDRMTEMAMKTLRVDPRNNPVAVARMRVVAEQIKRDLSFKNEAQGEVLDIGRGEGGVPLTLRCGLSRADLERFTRPMVDRTIDVTRTALKSAKLEVKAFDRVILVGGSTRMPLVARLVSEFFKKTPDQRINPDEVVALGAAIQANQLSNRSGRGRKKAPPPERAEAQASNAMSPAKRRAEPLVPPPEVLAHAVTTSPKLAARKNGPQAATDPSARKPGDVQEVRAKRFDPRAEPEEDDAEQTRNAPPPAPPPPPAPKKAPPPPAPTRPAIPAAAAKAAADGSADALTFERPARQLRWSSIPPALAPSSPTEVEQPPKPAQRVPSDPVPALPSEPRAPENAKPSPPSARHEIELPTGGHDVEVQEELAQGESLLIDVTPLSLRVETVGGYSDVLIAANSQVPCDRTRIFSTASDGQTQVFIRVAQGDIPQFSHNTFLGELELSGLVPLPRGEAQIAVTFEIDADGILAVHAKDGRTGAETKAKMHVFGAQTDEGDMATMMARQKQRKVV